MSLEWLESDMTRVQLDAWDDGPVDGELSEQSLGAACGRTGDYDERALGFDVVDPWGWKNPDVGWGLVLPQAPEGSSLQARWDATDAPEPVQELLRRYRADGLIAPVFRYDLTHPAGLQVLARPDPVHGLEFVASGVSDVGTGPGQLPRFLLMVAPPALIPWRLQTKLQTVRCVGRLPFWHEDADSLGHYIQALLSGWSGAAAKRQNTVVWAVDHSANDITHLMHEAIASPISSQLRAAGLSVDWIEDDERPASHQALVRALSESHPGLIVTSSHGATPVSDMARLRAQLGLPIDTFGQPLDLSGLSSWSPGGAIWFAQACCSAGSAANSRLLPLMMPGSRNHEVVSSVAALGSTVSPLAKTLLGASEPLRAFVGHVEPTTDWSLRHQLTGQPVVQPLTNAFGADLFGANLRTGRPLGHCLMGWYQSILPLLTAKDEAVHALDSANPARARQDVLYYHLSALDRSRLVILGDPTVGLQPSPGVLL